MRMMRRTPGKKTFWRWRHNPLRRRSDRVEAWIVLATWIIALAGGLLAGELAGAWLEDSLAARRAGAHRVAAVLTTAADGIPTVTEAGAAVSRCGRRRAGRPRTVPRGPAW